MTWTRVKKPPAARISSIIFIFVLFSAVYMYSRCIDSNILLQTGIKNKTKKQLPVLNCSSINKNLTSTQTCTSTNDNDIKNWEMPSSSRNNVCPNYFRWIHEDLKPWIDKGITLETLNRAEKTTNFRLVIVDGKVYMDKYRKSYQTRDVFTIWGILQLLRKYPGKVPDLDLMFDAGDRPVIKSASEGQSSPPSLFRYCGRDSYAAIVFPDWTFWGWPELRVKPWDTLLEELKEGNMKTKWMERDPYAYWKGNPKVAETREDLLKCNVSEKQDWNARVYAMDWDKERQQGFQQSSLANQCKHRYKIYIEGGAWSVSEKYILACDSLTLLVKPRYYDFFTRSLLPLKHYWPIKENDKCRSIKYAVDWGNENKQKAQEIGRTASNFIQEDLKMDYIYDYMFHLLNGYAKLLRFKPTIPPNAVQVCMESLACQAPKLQRSFMMESMIKSPSDTPPCSLPLPFDSPHYQAFLKQYEDSIKQVETWENQSRT